MFRHSCTREQHFNVVRLWLILWACIQYKPDPLEANDRLSSAPFFLLRDQNGGIFFPLPRLHVLVCGGRSGDASEQKGKKCRHSRARRVKFLCFLFDTLARTSQFFFKHTHLFLPRKTNWQQIAFFLRPERRDCPSLSLKRGLH